MYFIKQSVGLLTTPLVMALVIAALAATCRIFKRPKPATPLFVLAALVSWVSALGVVGDALLRPLECAYPPLREDTIARQLAYIVVLGSSYLPHDGIPVTAALDADGLARAVEGIRLARRIPGAKLIMSGGAPPGMTPPAFGYAVLARSLGLDDASLIILSDALDTQQEARAIAAVVGTETFILVTSAYHMPRAMRLMERAGTHPIPAPTAQRVSPASSARAWLPGAGGLNKTERALHEYLGLIALSAGFG